MRKKMKMRMGTPNDEMHTYQIVIKFWGHPLPVNFRISAQDDATARYLARRKAFQIWNHIPSTREMTCTLVEAA